MPLERRDWITKEMMRAEPDTLFVFGDNLGRWGRGGQAAEMRGEPNAVGLPTKVTPYIFLKDSDLVTVQDHAMADLRRLSRHLKAGRVVVWPTDGIGTGRAALASKAPQIAAFYAEALAVLERIGSNPTIGA